MAQTTRTIESQTLYRALGFDRGAVDEESRIAELAFSSEEPVERFFGKEILDHGPRSVRLKRLRSGGPLLVDHDPRDVVGVIEKVSIDDDRRGRARVRFGRSPRADEIFRDVLDGIRTGVSVGYRIHKMKGNDDETEFRAVDWEPLEVSLVSVPADISVGVGRSAADETHRIEIIQKENRTMSEETTTPTTPEPKAPTVDVEKIRTEARKNESARIREISAAGEKFNCRDLAHKAIEDGTPIEDFRRAVLDSFKPENYRPPQTDEIGLNDKEKRSFSLMRVIRSMADPSDRKKREEAAFEFEVSEAGAKRTGASPRGFYIPRDILEHKRDLTAGTDSAGGYLVGTDNMSFVDALRNRMVVRQLGAQVMSGLVGDVSIPTLSAGATAYWVTEASPTITEGAQTFGQISLSPKTVGAYTDMSHKLTRQSDPSVEAIVRNDLATILAIAVDLAALHGTGSSGQPQGIAGATNVGSVAIGTNGGAPTWASIVNLEREVAVDNALMGSTAYLTNAKAAAKLKTVYTNATYGEIPVWQGGPNAGDGIMNGYRALISNQVSSTLTKGSASGVCSAIFFGNWSDLIIGEWGGLDILVDPYTGSTTGVVRLRVMMDVDVALRHGQSFAAILDATTT